MWLLFFLTEALLNAEGTPLRQALFALKRIFKVRTTFGRLKQVHTLLSIIHVITQDDEDLVLEFVCNQGLNALVSVGKDSDQTYQQYILKALGELAVYVDGMHGLCQCNEMIQWLYELTVSKVSYKDNDCIMHNVVIPRACEYLSLLCFFPS